MMRMNTISPKDPPRGLIKSQSISLSMGAPIRLPQNWKRVLRFTQTPKFQINDLLQVFYDCLFFYSFNIVYGKKPEIRLLNNNFYNVNLNLCTYHYEYERIILVAC